MNAPNDAEVAGMGAMILLILHAYPVDRVDTPETARLTAHATSAIAWLVREFGSRFVTDFDPSLIGEIDGDAADIQSLLGGMNPPTPS